jgi:shikimate kinase
LCLSDNQVIATGGGVIIDYENVEIMKKNGSVIWLKATVETIKNRIFSDQMTEEQRPSLTSKGLENEIEETLSERNPLYTNAMDFFIDTDHVSIDSICSKLMVKLKEMER